MLLRLAVLEQEKRFHLHDDDSKPVHQDIAKYLRRAMHHASWIKIHFPDDESLIRSPFIRRI